MPPENPALVQAQRLYQLTLALESSLIEGRFEESEALFMARGECIETLSKLERDQAVHEEIEKIRKCESRIMGMLSDIRSVISRELGEAATGKKAVNLYGRIGEEGFSFQQTG